MRRSVLVLVLAAAFGASGVGAAAAAVNPSGTGRPTQDCNDLGTFPGHAAGSPGSPFNEGVGTGGLHYNETSQYDVACYQVGQR